MHPNGMPLGIFKGICYNSVMKNIILLTLLLSSILHANLKVCVSILPQAFFIEKLAGDLVDVEVLVKEGANPATYAPKPSQLRAIKDAKLYFTIGVAFEKNWLHRFLSINPDIKLIDTVQNIKKIAMQEHHEHKGGLDPHVWLDPKLVIKQIEVITSALIEEDRANEKIYLENKEAFLKDIFAIDLKIKEILSRSSQKEFIVFHPAFGYFAHAYGLKQVAIEKEGKEPSVKYIKKIIDFAKAHEIKTVFVAPQFSQKSAKQIAKLIHGTVKTINPLAFSWDKNILNIATSFIHDK